MKASQLLAWSTPGRIVQLRGQARPEEPAARTQPAAFEQHLQGARMHILARSEEPPVAAAHQGFGHTPPASALLHASPSAGAGASYAPPAPPAVTDPSSVETMPPSVQEIPEIEPPDSTETTETDDTGIDLDYRRRFMDAILTLRKRHPEVKRGIGWVVSRLSKAVLEDRNMSTEDLNALVDDLVRRLPERYQETD